MAGGISKDDVWMAADQLLLSGKRPTIDRVRQQIGRGSPNTVSPHLDTWFGSLGARIKDPLAFSAPPEIPDPIAQAAKHFWEVALTWAREEAGSQVVAARAEAQGVIDKARVEVSQAMVLLSSANQARDQALASLAGLHDSITQAKQAAAVTAVQLQETRTGLQVMQQRLEHQQADAATTVADLKQEIAAAIARADAADRRVAMELEKERAMRAKAERKADALEATLDKERSSSAQHLAYVQSSTVAAHEREARLVEELRQARNETQLLMAQLSKSAEDTQTQATQLAAALAGADALKEAFAKLSLSAPKRKLPAHRVQSSHPKP